MQQPHALKPLALYVSLAIAAATASTGALADMPQLSTTVYGIVSIDSVEASNVYNSSSAKSFSKFYIDNGAQSPSRLGFKGTHDINGDLKLNFGIEAGLRTDTGETTSGQLFNRGTFIGLSGKFGAVKAGRQWNLNDDIMGNYFVFGGYAAFRLSEFGDISNLYNNAIKYYSPTMGGVQAAVMLGAGESATSSDGSNMGEAAVTYNSGPFSSALSYHANKDATGTKTDRLTTAGANYTIGAFRPRLGYAISDQPTIPSKATVYDLGLDWTITQPLVLSFDFVSRDKKKSPDDTKYFRIRAMYAIDSAVSVYGNIIHLKNSGAASEHFYGDGQAGQKQNVFGVGLQYVF